MADFQQETAQTLLSHGWEKGSLPVTSLENQARAGELRGLQVCGQCVLVATPMLEIWGRFECPGLYDRSRT